MGFHASIRPAAALWLAAAFVSPAFSQDVKIMHPMRSIVVTGVGEATRAPDMATMTIGVDAEGATAAEALRRNSAQMEATMKSLKDAGVSGKDIQTAQISVGARYDYSQDGKPPRIIGYQATNSVVVKVKELGKAGAIIDRAVSVGANRLDSIVFGFDDPKPIMNDARRAAVTDGRDKAKLYADAAGVKLGQLMSISDSYAVQPGPVPMMARMEMDAAAKAVPIAPGESTASATVTLVYAIE
jgi:uncharacterized protein YggE